MKFSRITITAISLVFLAVQSASAVDLTLAERRGVESYQTNIYPAHLKRIKEAVGADVTVEVDWPALAASGQPESFSDESYWTNIYFIPLIDAFKTITRNDMGKKTLQAKTKKISITYNRDTAPATDYKSGVTFEGGILTVNFRPYSNADDIKDRTDAIREVLETKP